MKIQNHGSSMKDWCHLCGKRVSYSADIWYPENAEHDKENTQYIRICVECAKEIMDAALATPV